jgi:hypothetical protein
VRDKANQYLKILIESEMNLFPTIQIPEKVEVEEVESTETKSQSEDPELEEYVKNLKPIEYDTEFLKQLGIKGDDLFAQEGAEEFDE